MWLSDQQCLLSMCKALDLIPSITKSKKQQVSKCQGFGKPLSLAGPQFSHLEREEGVFTISWGVFGSICWSPPD